MRSSQLKYKESNILAVNKALPRGMRRSMWSVKDYTLSKRLHQVRLRLWLVGGWVLPRQGSTTDDLTRNTVACM